MARYVGLAGRLRAPTAPWGHNEQVEGSKAGAWNSRQPTSASWRHGGIGGVSEASVRLQWGPLVSSHFSECGQGAKSSPRGSGEAGHGDGGTVATAARGGVAMRGIGAKGGSFSSIRVSGILVEAASVTILHGGVRIVMRRSAKLRQGSSDGDLGSRVRYRLNQLGG